MRELAIERTSRPGIVLERAAGDFGQGYCFEFVRRRRSDDSAGGGVGDSMRQRINRVYGASRFRGRALPCFLDEGIEGDASVGVARDADSDAWRDLVLALDRLALRRCDVAGEGDEQVARDALLNSDVCSGRTLGVAVGKHRIDGELRDPGYFRDATGYLARNLVGDEGLGGLVGGRCCSGAGFSSLAKGEQMDDVG